MFQQFFYIGIAYINSWVHKCMSLLHRKNASNILSCCKLKWREVKVKQFIEFLRFGTEPEKMQISFAESIYWNYI